MTEPKKPVSQEELSTWVREQFQRANQHLASEGVLFESVVVEESRYLAPLVAMWKIKSQQQEFFWVISGDVPADFIPAKVAKTARDAFRHISLKWQLKAEGVMASADNDPQAKQLAEHLISKAETLYTLYEDEKLWA